MDDESHLIRAMARRDRAAWATMYDRHVGDLFGLVYHLLGGDRGAAEDVNQEVWLLAIEQFDRFDPGRGAFRDWLMGIARHRALRYHRHAWSQAPENHIDGPSDSLPPPELLEEVERADVVRAALLCLHEDYRQVLLDKYVVGLSVADIAGRSGRSDKAVESLLSRARARLRSLLGPYFSAQAGRRSP
jgi:RNA polymerase sigma-70 factor (ECF subfamily)